MTSAPGKELSDEALVQEAQRELPYVTTSYETLMRRHSSLIFGLCLRILEHRQDAEEAAQEVMFKVFTALPQFESRSKFRTWLTRIVINSCSTLRARRRRQADLASALQVEGGGPEAARIDTGRMDTESLLAMLGEADRNLIVLRFVADMSFEEIADSTGLTLSATKMRIYRAIDKLKGNV